MKKLGNALMGVLIFLAFIFLCLLFFKGAQFLAFLMAPMIVVAPTLMTIGAILILLSLIPSLKERLLPAIFTISLIQAFILFVYSAYLVLDIFSLIWLIVGILLGGIGIVPIAMIACLMTGHWGILTNLLFISLTTYFFRLYAIQSAISLSMEGYAPKSPQDQEAVDAEYTVKD